MLEVNCRAMNFGVVEMTTSATTTIKAEASMSVNPDWKRFISNHHEAWSLRRVSWLAAATRAKYTRPSDNGRQPSQPFWRALSLSILLCTALDMRT
jgi:hypothetical protein